MRDEVGPQLNPGDDVGGYTIEAPLGIGGYGAVYLARRGARRYALKLMNLRRVRGSAHREVDLLNRLRHRHVVGFWGCGYYPDANPEYLYVVMEYVDGRRLSTWADEANPSARQAAEVVLAMARALKVLHGQGVVHRDLKESNVLIRRQDGEVKLIDFGLATYGGAVPVTPLGMVTGTPEYLPPEAWRYRLELSERTQTPYEAAPSHDVWALGVMLYRLLTGRHPFEVPEDVEALLEGRCVPPHERNERVPRELGEVCVRLLAGRLEERLADAGALAVELEGLLARAGEGWDVALCEAHRPDNLSTEVEPGALDTREEVARWVQQARYPPRRGPRPARGGAAPVPAADVVPARAPAFEAAPEAPMEMPSTPGRVVQAQEVSAVAAQRPGAGAAWRRARWWVTGVLLGALLVALAAGGLLPRSSDRPPIPAVPVAPVQEVARGGPAPDARGAAAPVVPGPTPAVAAPAAPAQEETAVKPTHDPVPSQPVRKAPGPHPFKKTVATASAAVALACAGTPTYVVRSAPAAIPCPEGAVQSMKQLGIKVGERKEYSLKFGGLRHPVREGWVEVLLIEDWGKLPEDTVLAGRVYFADRAYIRLTQARLPGRSPIPVCLEAWDKEDNMRGLEMLEESTPEAAIVTNVNYACAVDRFE